MFIHDNMLEFNIIRELSVSFYDLRALLVFEDTCSDRSSLRSKTNANSFPFPSPLVSLKVNL